MILKRIFDYNKLDINFPIRDDTRLYSIEKGKKRYGILILREFINSQVVNFNIKEPIEEERYEELFEKIVSHVKDLGSSYILHYTMSSNPFSDFLLKKGGEAIERIGMVLDLEKFSPLSITIPYGMKIRPFIIGPLRENVDICFNSIPEYDRKIFSTQSSDELFLFYTYLYTGREGIFMPKLSLNIYSESDLLGFILVNTFAEERLTISEIVIFSSYQGKGFGKLLLNETLKRAKAQGHKRLFLSVTKKNKRAYNMYKKFGFEEVKYYVVYVYKV